MMAYKKFDVGAMVRFELHHPYYPTHSGHSAVVMDVDTYPKRRHAGTVVVYEIQCCCDATLHPQGYHIQEDEDSVELI